MRRSLFAGSIALLLGSTAAYADCVQTGLDVTCTGIDADGFGDGSGATDDLTITVKSGATVEGGATGRAFEVDDKTSITVEAGASVMSQANEGIEGDNDITINNAGVIEAFDDAIQVNDGAMIVNSGRIENIGDNVDPQDAIDIDSGTITNTATGIIRSTEDAAIDVDGGEKGDVTVNNAGLIQGTIAVLKDPSNEAGQLVYNTGSVIGTSGVALDLGEGSDLYRHSSGAILIGSALLGNGDDLFEMFAVEGTGRFGGTGAVMDGGVGTDLFDFGSLDIMSALSASFDGLELLLNFGTLDGELEVLLTNWETVRFRDFSGDQAAVAAAVNSPAVVPLPATMWMLGAGLGLLGAASRRRRA
ncbi:MAG: hypothetical protein JXR75_00840 [Rhodobacteraceae bacterium]|nr:hypothetical protein [Paracoccaceae bacterium]